MANLYAYFAGTAVTIVLLLLMPPYRPIRWLSSLAEPEPLEGDRVERHEHTRT